MIVNEINLDSLIGFAVEQFKMAKNNGAKTPEGVCIVTRDGIRFGGHSYNDSVTAGGNALTVLRDYLDTRVPDELRTKFEIETIVIATPFDEKRKISKAPQENTLKDLADYIGTRDGQIIYVVSPNREEIRTIKL